MLDFWHSRWQTGQHGWHEAGGNEALREFWPTLDAGSRVLVPLCGKSVDLLWLAKQGAEVIGVEVSEIAARSFFEEAGLQYEMDEAGGLNWFRNLEAGIAIACGNYFEFSDRPFDALYDRASLVALPPKKRPEYIRRTKNLLKPGAAQLLLTLEYDDTDIEGPPFSVFADEVFGYWPGLRRVREHNDIENSPPKFRDVGITEVIEVVWAGSATGP